MSIIRSNIDEYCQDKNDGKHYYFSGRIFPFVLPAVLRLADLVLSPILTLSS